MFIYTSSKVADSGLYWIIPSLHGRPKMGIGGMKIKMNREIASETELR